MSCLNYTSLLPFGPLGRDGQWAVLPTEPECGNVSDAAAAAAATTRAASPGVLTKPSATALANLRTKTGINSSTLARYTVSMADGV